MKYFFISKRQERLLPGRRVTNPQLISSATPFQYSHKSVPEAIARGLVGISTLISNINVKSQREEADFDDIFKIYL